MMMRSVYLKISDHPTANAVPATKNKVKSAVTTITHSKAKNSQAEEEIQQAAVRAGLKSLLILIHRMFLILVIRIQLLVR